MGVLNENQLLGASGAGSYEIEQSLRFNDDDGSYLSRTPSSAGNRKTFTYSVWIKRGNLSVQQRLFGASSSSSHEASLHIYQDTVEFFNYYGSSPYPVLTTTQVFRDPSAWYHLVIVADTTNSTQGDRLRMYVNGERVTAFSQEVYPALNYDYVINESGISHLIGLRPTNLTNPLDGYLAEINFIDGQALTPDSFGETGDYGEWKPIAYAGTYGTNGFYLDFADSSSLGNDAAGSNNWTPTNLAATDQMLDSPTNNFCTWNPLDSFGTPVLSEGNLKFQLNTARCRGTIASQSDGKIYFEVYNPTLVSNSNVHHMGLASIGLDINNASNMENAAGGGATIWTYANANGRSIYARQNGSNIATVALPNQIAAGDIIAFASDSSTGKVWMSQNNSWLKANGSFDGSNALSSSNYLFQLATGHELTPLTMPLGSTPSTIGVLNCGQDSSFAGAKTPQGNQDSNDIGDFFYQPPSGFLALCTSNLPSVDVIPSEHFNTVLYTGTRQNKVISGVGFQPDLIWLKTRSTASNHALVDSVRGGGKALQPSTTSYENQYGAQDDKVTAFSSDGFSLGVDAGGYGFNDNNSTYVAWNWKAGGAASSNTNGSITSSVSANVDAGFSIVSYTGNGTSGATVGHGLTLKIPELIIIKNRTKSGENWAIGIEGITGVSNDSLKFTTEASNAGTGYFAGSSSSTLFTLGNAANSNFNTSSLIAYCFHSVDGYSKVGKLVGNGNADGPFVHCGFRPAWVMWKRTDAAQEWHVFDTARDEYNPLNKDLWPPHSSAEYTGYGGPVDYLSNGFKFRTSSVIANASGGTYIFLAFAENPFKHTNAR